MKGHLKAMAELFRLARMYPGDKVLHTAILAKQLELSMEPTAALEHWNKNKGELHRIADTLIIQQVSEFLEMGVRQ